jgi:phytanoyl-CoA hydroxylase
MSFFLAKGDYDMSLKSSKIKIIIQRVKMNMQEIKKQFQKDGFVVLKNFASHEMCDKILAKALEHFKAKTPPYETEEEYTQQGDTKEFTLRRLRRVYEREEVFQEWMKNSQIRDMAKEIFNDEVNLLLAHHNSIMTKTAYTSSETSWHQDIRYWNFEDDSLLSVWLALDDEYLDNGLLEFIPGSHTMKFKPEQFDEMSNFRDDLEENKKIIAKRVHERLKKGDVVLFHAKTLHHANMNKTDKPKISFVYTLKARHNKFIKNTRSDDMEIEL